MAMSDDEMIWRIECMQDGSLRYLMGAFLAWCEDGNAALRTQMYDWATDPDSGLS